MADLKEQLLKAGLITEKQARQTTHQQRVENKQVGRPELQRRARQAQEETARQREAQQKQDRQRGAEAGRRQETREQARRGQQHQETAIRAAYRQGAVPRWEGQRVYYFTDGTRVEMLHANDDAVRRLSEGSLAIVRAEAGPAGYTLLTGTEAERLREAAPERVVCHHR